MKVHDDVKQRSEEWHALRRDRLCSSRANDMLAMTYPDALTPTGKPSRAKPKEQADRRNLRAELVLARITGRSQERGFQSQAMLDGIEREQAALEKYEEITGRIVRPVGFVAHDDLMAGWSPDGVIGDFVGAVEAKSPIAATHLDYLRTGKVPLKYYRQCLHALWLVPSLEWIDWFSYQPEFTGRVESLQMKCVRIYRNNDEIADYDRKARAFLAEVDAEVQALLTMCDIGGVLREALSA